MKFGISTLMVLVFVCAVIFGIQRHSFVAFGIGFAALGILIMQLMAKSGPRPVVVEEGLSEVSAHMLGNFLRTRGIDARVETGWGATAMYSQTANCRVVVPPGQAERAAAILRESRAKSTADPPGWQQPADDV